MTDGIAALGELTGISGDVLSTAFHVFLRVGGMVAVLPGVGEAMLPLRLRIAIVVAMSALAIPLVPAIPVVAMSPVVLVAEIAVGLMLGFVVRLLVQALQIVGAIIAAMTSLSQMTGGATVDPQPAVGTALVLSGTTLMFAMGLHVDAVRMIAGSYSVLPAGLFPAGADVAPWATAAIGKVFALAFALAAPFVILGLLYNVAIGLANRALPQMMVTFVGAPLLSLGGLALLAATAPVILETWHDAATDRLAAPFEVTR
jgi:flagellar biosynthesis protein FliR